MIYLDHHAATPVCSDATSAMRAAEAIAWANPASVHAAGRSARRVLEQARASIATSIGSDSNDIVLTAGGTEACNLGVIGVVDDSRSSLVVGTLEHPAVRGAALDLVSHGLRILDLTAIRGGVASPSELAGLLDSSSVALVAVQWVNHETGTIWPIEAYARVCRERGVRLFVDATQAWGKLPIEVSTLGATALAIASHKAGGPAGAGALWVERGLDLQPRMLGGGQERGRRAGSPDPVVQAGFAAAAEALGGRLAAQPRLGALRDRLEASAVALGGVVNGAEGPRVATVTNVSFQGRTGPALVAALDLEGVCCSSGAACSSGVNEVSPVLRAMYPDAPWRAGAAIRFSLGPETTETDVEIAVQALQRVLQRPPA